MASGGFLHSGIKSDGGETDHSLDLPLEGQAPPHWSKARHSGRREQRGRGQAHRGGKHSAQWWETVNVCKAMVVSQRQVWKCHCRLSHRGLRSSW